MYISSGISSASGIRTRFGEITVENLRIDNRYSMRELAGLPLAIENDSDNEIVMQIDVLAPSANELKPGYEAIPDISWIKIEKTMLTIGPHMQGETDVIISIPNESKFEGRRYQVYLWSHTVGEFIGLGLKSRLLFSIISGENGAEKGERKLSGSFEFEAAPLKIVLKNVEPGKGYDVEKETGTVLKLKNIASKDKRFSVRSIRVSDSHAEVPEGFLECPKPSFLSLETAEEFVLPAGGERIIRMHVRLPENLEYRNKNYLFIILIEQGSARMYSRLYVSTKE
jgi:hypothetical protein